MAHFKKFRDDPPSRRLPAGGCFDRLSVLFQTLIFDQSIRQVQERMAGDLFSFAGLYALH